MLKAIVFDFDGVLVDSEPLHYQAFLHVLRPLGVEFDYDYYLAELVGFDDREAFEHLRKRMQPAGGGDANPSAAHTAPSVAELCQQKQAAFERLIERGMEPVPGAMALVDAAAARLPIAIASGAVIADIAPILDQLGRRERFEAIVSADQVARSKPAPETYAVAVQRLGEAHPSLALEPGACLAIEDTAAGLAAARAAGLRRLGLTTTHPAHELYDAERVVETLTDLTLDDLHAWFG